MTFPSVLDYSSMVVFAITSGVSKRQPSNISFNPLKRVFCFVCSLLPYFVPSHSLWVGGRCELILHNSVRFLTSGYVHFEWIAGNLKQR